MDNTSQEGNVEAVTMTDILNLSTWQRLRTTDELESFITRREAALAEPDAETE